MDLNHAAKLLDVPADADVAAVKLAYEAGKGRLRDQYAAAQTETDREVCREKLHVLRLARNALLAAATVVDPGHMPVAEGYTGDKAKTHVLPAEGSGASQKTTDFGSAPGQSRNTSGKPHSGKSGTQAGPSARSYEKSAADSSLQHGSVLVDRFEIHTDISSGIVGRVYSAYDRKRGENVALHVIPSSALGKGEARTKLLADLRTISSVSHPSIAAVFYIREIGPDIVVATQLLDGHTLRDTIDARKLLQQPFDLHETLTVARHLCVALTALHRITVHGNLRPENVILCGDGNPKLSGAGMSAVARMKEDPRVGGANGDPFRAPETLGASARPDSRSDQYSLAAILYEMLLSEPAAAAIGARQPLPRAVPAPVVDAILRGLRPEPEARFQTVSEFAAALGVGDGFFAGANLSPASDAPAARGSFLRAFALTMTLLAIGVTAFVAYESGWIPTIALQQPQDARQPAQQSEGALELEAKGIRGSVSEFRAQLEEIRASARSRLDGVDNDQTKRAALFQLLNQLVDDAFAHPEVRAAEADFEEADDAFDASDFSTAIAGYEKVSAPLRDAALRGRALETAALMLANHDQLESPPLHQAAASGNLALATAMIDLGANVLDVDGQGLTVLDVAKAGPLREYLEQIWPPTPAIAVEVDNADSPEPEEPIENNTEVELVAAEAERAAAEAAAREQIGLEVTLERLERERRAREDLEREMAQLQDQVKEAEAEARRKAKAAQQVRVEPDPPPRQSAEETAALARKKEQAARELQAAQDALNNPELPDQERPPLETAEPLQPPPPRKPEVMTDEERLAAQRQAEQDAIRRAIMDETGSTPPTPRVEPIAQNPTDPTPTPPAVPTINGVWNVTGNRPEVEGSSSPIGTKATFQIKGAAASLTMDYKELTGTLDSGRFRGTYDTTISATGRSGKGKTSVDQHWEIDLRVVSADRIEGWYRVTHRGFQASEAAKNGTQSQFIALTR